MDQELFYFIMFGWWSVSIIAIVYSVRHHTEEQSEKAWQSGFREGIEATFNDLAERGLIIIDEHDNILPAGVAEETN